jgi:hypothetical protein
MLNLIVGDGTSPVVDNAMVPVRWCVDKQDFDYINSRGVFPHVIISVLHDEPTLRMDDGTDRMYQAETTRVIVPFSDGMAYVPINRPGQAEIRSTVVVFHHGLSARTVKSLVKSLAERSSGNRFYMKIHDAHIMNTTGKFEFSVENAFERGRVIDVGPTWHQASPSGDQTGHSLRANWYVTRIYSEADALEDYRDTCAEYSESEVEISVDEFMSQVTEPIDPSRVYGQYGLRDTGMETCMSRVVIDVPRELFAKPLPSWMQNILMNGYRSKPTDQCEIRQRLLRAAVWDMWVIGVRAFFVTLLRFIFASVVTVGALHRHVNWRMVFQPFSGQMVDVFYGCSLGDTYLGKLTKVWMLPLMPIVLAIAGLVSYVIYLNLGLVLHVIGPAFFVACAVAGLASGDWVANGVGRVGRVINRFNERRLTTAYASSLENVVCRGNPMDMVASVDKIPSKTIRLRFSGLKSKVCKPTAL